MLLPCCPLKNCLRPRLQRHLPSSNSIWQTMSTCQRKVLPILRCAKSSAGSLSNAVLTTDSSSGHRILGQPGVKHHRRGRRCRRSTQVASCQLSHGAIRRPRRQYSPNSRPFGSRYSRRGACAYMAQAADTFSVHFFPQGWYSRSLFIVVFLAYFPAVGAPDPYPHPFLISAEAVANCGRGIAEGCVIAIRTHGHTQEAVARDGSRGHQPASSCSGMRKLGRLRR